MCAIAVLGSLALVPTQTLARNSGHDGGHGHSASAHAAKTQHGHSADARAITHTGPPASSTPAHGNPARSHALEVVSAEAPAAAATAAPLVAASAPNAAAPLRGVSLPGTAVPISRPPAAAPASSRTAPAARPRSAASTAPSTPVLGPVPVLVPSLGEAVSPAAAGPPWSWLVAFAIVDVLLAMFVVLRRRRAGSRSH